MRGFKHTSVSQMKCQKITRLTKRRNIESSTVNTHHGLIIAPWSIQCSSCCTSTLIVMQTNLSAGDLRASDEYEETAMRLIEISVSPEKHITHKHPYTTHTFPSLGNLSSFGLCVFFCHANEEALRHFHYLLSRGVFKKSLPIILCAQIAHDLFFSSSSRVCVW